MMCINISLYKSVGLFLLIIVYSFHKKDVEGGGEVFGAERPVLIMVYTGLAIFEIKKPTENL